MPPKRKRGGARGRPTKQDKPESLDSSREDLQGEEGETADDSLLEENISELEMSVDLDKSQVELSDSILDAETEGGESKGEDGTKDDVNGEDEKETMEVKGDEGIKVEEVEQSQEVEKSESGVNVENKNEEDKDAKKTPSKDDKMKENKEKASKDEKKAVRTGLLETPETRHLESIDTRSVKVIPIAPFDVKEMRSHWKWSIRISPVKPEDVMASDLMTMPRVQDAYYHVSHQENGHGQMELCTQNTNDTILAMLRVLRSPFANRTLTIEITKRSFVKMDKKGKESADANATMSETKPVQESADGVADTEMDVDSEVGGKDEGKKEEAKVEEEQKKEEEMEEDEDGEHTKGGAEDGSIIWGEAKETAAFVVNLNRVQKINLKSSKKLKGDLFRRSVYVGTLPKRTTEEILKVIFPVANSIIMKPADDPNMRNAFIETSNHANCVGFVTSYVGLKLNGQELKLSIRAQDLAVLKVEEKEKKDVKKEVDEAEEEKNKDVSDENVVKKGEETEAEEMKSAKENIEETEGKTEKSEKLDDSMEGKEEESGKKDKKKTEGRGAFRELSEEEKKARAQLNRQKKKRKREFMEEVHREWSAKKPRQDQGPPASMPPGMGPRFPFKPPQGRGMFPFGRGDGGPMAGPPTPPLFHIQDKIANLLRLQGQLEKTINTQMEFIQHSEAAARQQAAEQRLRDMVMISQELAFEESRAMMGSASALRGRGGFQGGGDLSPQGGKYSGNMGGRNFGGAGGKAGGKQRDFHRSPSFGDGSYDSQGQGGGFAKRFRKDSDSRYDSFKGGKGFQGGNQGNAFRGQKAFGGGDDSYGGNQFDDSFGGGSNFGGGKKFGRGGKFGGGADQMGGGKFGGGNQTGGGKFGGKGNQRGGGKFGGGKKFGDGGNNFGGDSNKFSAGWNKRGAGKKFGRGANQKGSGSSFGGDGMNVGSGYGGSSTSWGSESYGGSNYGSGMASGNYSSTTTSGNFGTGSFNSGNMTGMGSTSSYSTMGGGYNSGATGGQYNWKYGQNQMGGQQW